jgi:23S rRNA-/tRNA-specific pseudouridylate synthase
VHTKHLGHPIIGDAAYANDWVPYRLFLHAHRLHLPLYSDRELRLEASSPFDGHLVPLDG